LDLKLGAADQAQGQCPWCGKIKFLVNQTNGKWDCKTCGTSGNLSTFIRKLWEQSDRATGLEVLEPLRVHRGLMLPETLMGWGVVRSTVTGEWLLPGYDQTGRMDHLYRYVQTQAGDGVTAWKVNAVKGMYHKIFGMPVFAKQRGTVYVCEGPWDGMALWESLRAAKWADDNSRLMYTANPLTSLLADANVIAVPSAYTYNVKWNSVFAGKRVVLCYDNDHPRTHPRTGQKVKPAGLDGMRRAAEIMAAAEVPPAEICYLKWGESGYHPGLKDGLDVRDVLAIGGSDWPGRVAALQGLLEKVYPIPEDWVAGRTFEAKRKGGTELEALPCSSWVVLSTAWRKSMKWTEGLDRALSVMLAVVASTRAAGDQLWMKVIGPAGCGKSTLCEALSVNKKRVKARSTIRGFHTGFRGQKDESGQSEDMSLIAVLNGTTLVTKDGDTLMQSPNVGQILSEARDLYDGNTRSHYRNGAGREHENHRMTWLLCGTGGLRALDRSELGERFLDCVIMESIDDDLEDEVLDRVFNRARKAAGMTVNGKPETQNTPDMTRCMQLTSGFINWLRDTSDDNSHEERAVALANRVVWSEEMQALAKALAKFVSHMRARPSIKQDETVEREFSARLLSQMVRLAAFMAVVLGRQEVDAEVMRRVRQVALDSARGWSLKMADHLYKTGDQGMEAKALAYLINYPDEKARGLLRFLCQIGACEVHQHKIAAGLSAQKRYRLTPKMQGLYEAVVVNG
jgi:hypothetical protein